MKKVTLLGVLFFAFVFSAHAQNYKLRTVVVYSFTRYIHWPEEMETGDFNIRVYGDSPFMVELENMARMKKIGNRSINVAKVNTLSEVGKCHILIVPSDKSKELEGVIRNLLGKPTLVVTEEPGLGTKGSDINFVDIDGKLAFELNRDAITKRNLKASIELTRLAILI